MTPTPTRVAVLLAALALTACDYPRDPDDTLARVESTGELKAGIAVAPPWTQLTDGQPSGVEVDLVTAFAEDHGAEVAWQHGGEEELFRALERGEIDLLVAGLTEENPWKDKAGMTRPYRTVPGPEGEEKHVMAVPVGENAMVSALEGWLEEHAAEESK